MSNLDTSKKPAHQDWHKADIKAALEKAGWSLRKLSIASGYKPSTLRAAFTRPYHKAEVVLAEAVGRKPQQIWPTRYKKDGTPLQAQRRLRINPRNPKHSSDGHGRNVKLQGAA
jgi:Ner family transcriptional regulator